MSNDNTQIRGHCQVCGRIQAVRSGRMAHHGYRVKNGWFVGKCWGHNHAPMEKDIEVTKEVIKNISLQVDAMTVKLEELRVGKWHPTTVRGRYNPKISDYDSIPWDEAKLYQQVGEIEREAHGLDSRIRGGESFIKAMTELMERVHGEPLTEVKRAPKPEQILIGEQRLSHRGVTLTVISVSAARVKYQLSPSAAGWLGTRAWRALKKVA